MWVVTLQVGVSRPRWIDVCGYPSGFTRPKIQVGVSVRVPNGRSGCTGSDRLESWEVSSMKNARKPGRQIGRQARDHM